MQQSRSRILITFFACLFFGYILAPDDAIPKYPEFIKKAGLKLGLDLRGGAELTYRVLCEPGDDKTAVTRQVIDALENRINNKGLKEPDVRMQGEDQIIVQIPESDQAGLEEMKTLFKTAGKLELMAVASKDLHEEYERTKIVPPGHLKKSHAENERSGYPGISAVLVEQDPVITGEDLASASVSPPELGGEWAVSFQVKPEPAIKFNEAARRLYDQDPEKRRMLAIILDGKIFSTPSVNSASFDEGKGLISGSFTQKSAEQLALILRSGHLKRPIGSLDKGTGIPESQYFVGASLGEDSIRRGMIATIVSGIAVAFFMIAYYLGGGMIAVIGLIINFIFIFGIMALFNATLTLPGIAGLALTVGMAVDANILILERIREEMALGKTAMQAFEAGHHRAFSAIFDGNFTTLLAALALFLFGTPPIRGFALTLSIGVLCTLISVLYCSRAIMHVAVGSGILTQFKMRKILSNPSFKFTRTMKPAVLLSLIAMIGSVGIFLATGDQKYGIDFRGGTLLNFTFRQPQEAEWVRQATDAIKDPQSGNPRYGGARIQPIAEDNTVVGQGSASRQFQLRTPFQDATQVRQDIQNAFQDHLSHIPFSEVPEAEVPKSEFELALGAAGGGWYLFLEGADTDVTAIEKTLQDGLASLGSTTITRHEGALQFKLERSDPEPRISGITRARLLLLKTDVDRQGKLLADVRKKISEMGEAGKIPLSRDPFTFSGFINPTIAQAMKDKTMMALIVSWILIIAYVAVRFASWKFGVAAVIALVHDAVISVGVTVLCGMIVPPSWGLSFEMDMVSVAAILTIIGFSVNDTIVTYDRIRENLHLMKKESFAEIVDKSINQTLSRTVLTSLTAWLSVVILYVVTMQSAGGIATFAFPLLVGMIVGVYSTIFIAAPIVVSWYKNTKPVFTK